MIIKVSEALAEGRASRPDRPDLVLEVKVIEAFSWQLYRFAF